LGAHVVIIPDNDKPGLQHAEKVAQSLYGKAVTSGDNERNSHNFLAQVDVRWQRLD